MSAVLVNGDRVDVPEGWIAVVSGPTQEGDKSYRSWPRKTFAKITEEPGGEASCYSLIIRRDPKETP